MHKERHVMNNTNEMPIEEKESKWSLATYFKSLKLYKWWIIGTTAVLGIGGYLGTKFLINSSREQLTTSFGYDINTYSYEQSKKENGILPILYFADSSIFNYTDIVSESHLNAVKEAKADEYKNINVSSILKNSGVKIERASYIDSTTSKTVYEIPERYVLSFKRSYFNSETQGKNFIKDLINYELIIAEKANNSYRVQNYIGNNFSSLELSNRVEALVDQYDAINKLYSDLFKAFSGSVFVSESETLNGRYNDFVQKYISGASNKFEAFSSEYYSNHYVIPGVDTAEGLRAKAANYIESLSNVLNSIDMYQKSLDDLLKTQIFITDADQSSVIQNRILELNEIIINLKKSQNRYVKDLVNLGYVVPNDLSSANISEIKYNEESGATGCIQFLETPSSAPSNWVEDCNSFISRLNQASEGIQVDVQNAESAYHFVYNNFKNRANIYTTGIAKLEGHISGAVGVVAGLLVGYVLSSVILMIVYMYAPKKEEKKN